MEKEQSRKVSPLAGGLKDRLPGSRSLQSLDDPRVFLATVTGHMETLTSLSRSELWVLKTRVRVPVLVRFTCRGLSLPSC